MSNRAFAWMAVLLMLATPFAVVCASDEEEDSEALIPALVALPVVLAGGTAPASVSLMESFMLWMGISMVAGAGAGFVAGWEVHELLEPDGTDARRYARLMEASDMALRIETAAAFTATAELNYSDLWKLTKEHWVRQAELQAYADWTANSQGFDADKTLTDSLLLRNAAVMDANAVAQLNLYLDQMSEVIGKWQTKDTYTGKMSAGFYLGGTAARTTSSGLLEADMLAAADARAKAGTVYIGLVQDDEVVNVEDYSPSYVYTDNGAIITGMDRSYTLSKGMNDLAAIDGFRPGIYYVSSGSLIAGDTLAPVTSQNALPLHPAIAMRGDQGWGLAYLDGDSVRMEGRTASALKFRVTAQEIPSGTSQPADVDLTPALKGYGELLESIRWTMHSAVNSARAVWDVYDSLEDRVHAVTTLMAPDTYDGWMLSSGMKEAMTVSAMQQLCDHVIENGESRLEDLYISLYRDGEVQRTPFVLGDVTDSNGTVIHRNAVFTPFFQQRDATLRAGTEHQAAQNTMLMVWGYAEEGESLRQWWDRACDEGTLYYQHTLLEKGSTISPDQLGECDEDGMHDRQELELRVTMVNFNDPTKVRDSDPADPPESTVNWLVLALAIIGAVLAAYGIVTRDPRYIVAGAAVLVFALVFGDTIWEWLTNTRSGWGLL